MSTRRETRLMRTSPTLDQLIRDKKSMLSEDFNLPIRYGAIEHASDIEEEAFPKLERQVRVYIVWDNPLKDHPINRVLDHMRETGAAMVQKVEAIEP